MILSILATLLAVWCYVVEFRRDLMMLQQNSYRNERYNRWLHASQDTTSAMRLVSGAVVLASMSTLSVPFVGMILITVVSLVNIVTLSRRKYKKPLVMTQRAWRILLTMLVLSFVVVVPAAVIGLRVGHALEYAAIAALLVYCFSQ